MGEHTDKQFVYLRQKQGRIHTQRERVWASFSNEEEHSKSQAGQKYTPREEWGHPEWGVQWGGDLNHLGRTVLLAFCLHLTFLIFFFFHTWLVPGPSPTCVCNFLLRWISPQRPVGGMSTLIMGWCPLPFLTPKEPSCACADREVFLDLRSGHLISFLQQSSASATSFVLGVSGWKQTSVLLHLTNTSCLAQGHSSLLPQTFYLNPMPCEYYSTFKTQWAKTTS